MHTKRVYFNVFSWVSSYIGSHDFAYIIPKDDEVIPLVIIKSGCIYDSFNLKSLQLALNMQMNINFCDGRHSSISKYCICIPQKYLNIFCDI